MAGGKETPRQKMIGMMYLVLTALLALNVTKEVVNAFVTINDKLDASATIIDNKVDDDYTAFYMKKMALISRGEDLKIFNIWNTKADSLEGKTTTLISYLLGECNDMIKEAEGEDWIAEDGKDKDGYITKLKPLMKILVKDNYDIPTQLFVGSDPLNPISRGLDFRKNIHEYRDQTAVLMATYQEKSKKWSFIPPKEIGGLKKALQTANPEDTSKIAQFYRALTIPEKLFSYGEGIEMPWVSATFNLAPIVAAAAMITSLKVDVKNAQSIAVEYMLAKIDVIPFVINKIEPMAFASSGYINKGDSLGLKVLIAAYDSTEVNRIRWGMDADTLSEKWTETEGTINLDGTKSGVHIVKGAIGVRERNEIVWKPWRFDYTVGEPMGVISQPGMRLLYRGYNNVIEAAASGFPSDKISVGVSSGCTVVRQNGQWVVRVGSGIRNATITVRAEKEDGSVITVASNTFEVKQMPKPEIFLGGITSGERPTVSNIRAQTRISLRFGEGVPLTNVRFTVVGGIVEVNGIQRKGRITSNSGLDANAVSILRQSAGKRVTITCEYRDPSGVKKKAVPFLVNVR